MCVYKTNIHFMRFWRPVDVIRSNIALLQLSHNTLLKTLASMYMYEVYCDRLQTHLEISNSFNVTVDTRKQSLNSHATELARTRTRRDSTSTDASQKPCERRLSVACWLADNRLAIGRRRDGDVAQSDRTHAGYSRPICFYQTQHFCLLSFNAIHVLAWV